MTHSLPYCGPPDARILILCDYPSLEEKRRGKPLSDWAGGQFLATLTKIGILSTSCGIATFLPGEPEGGDLARVISTRKTCPGPGWEFVGDAWVAPSVMEASQRLAALLERVKPSLVITLGPAALWALTGQTNTLAWRGSRLTPPAYPFTVVPTFAPRLGAAQPELFHTIRADLIRAKNIFEGTQVPRTYHFQIEPKFDDILAYLRDVAKAPKLSGDLETRAYHIACFGIAPSADEAICIPFLKTSGESPFYWEPEAEAEIIAAILPLFQSETLWVGQNFSYDCQYFYRFWLTYPRRVRDTMIGHHSIFSTSRKSLDYLSSIYAQDHIYWKEDIRNWDPNVGERQYWTYNCTDAVRTFEIDDEIQKTLGSLV